jgi:hypothetical protein
MASVEQRLGERRPAQRARQGIGRAFENLDALRVGAFEELECPAVAAEKIASPIE